MTDNNEQFIINDIDMAIAPSDIQVMDDNWVVEDSFLRSKAVYCFRSKYASTKVVLNIPFKIQDATLKDTEQSSYNCIKLVSELINYPYCFIKNNRIKHYISPPSISSTGYLMFAVEEVTINQDAQASGVLFIEVVLQYFNHSASVTDFYFRKNLNVTEVTEGTSQPLVSQVADELVDNMSDSDVWKAYVQPRVDKVFKALLKGKDNLYNVEDTILKLSIGTPIIQPASFKDDESVEEFKKRGGKVFTVTDVKGYDNGKFEKLLTETAGQDFAVDANGKPLDGSMLDDDAPTKEGRNLNPFMDLSEEDADKEKEHIKSYSNPDPKADSRNYAKNNSGKVDMCVEWSNQDLNSMGIYVNSIQIKYRNNLSSHQIASYKHPIVQFMGKDPVSVNIGISAKTDGVYETDIAAAHTYIKQIINVLDFNRSIYPEAEGYNFFKIDCFATTMLGINSFVPGQSVISATAQQPGVDNIIYAFTEGNLSSFLEEVQVMSSGKKSQSKTIEGSRAVVMNWLGNFMSNPYSKLDDFDPADAKVYRNLVALAVISLDDIGYKYKDLAKALNSTSEFKAPWSVYVPIAISEPLSGLAYTEVSDVMNPFTNKVYINTALKSNTKIIKQILELIFELETGGKPNKGNISYLSSGRFKLQLNRVIAAINNSNSTPTSKIKTALSTREGIDDYMSDEGSSFFGYNLKDLELDTLVPNYNEETDILVSQIDPFFFISQETMLNGFELDTIYTSLYTDVLEPDIIGSLNNTKANEDPTSNMKALQNDVGIIKITEIDISDKEEETKDNTLLRAGSAIGGNKDLVANVYNRYDGVVSTGDVAKTLAVGASRRNLNSTWIDYMDTLARVESGYGKDRSSPTGATGLYQITEVFLKEVNRVTEGKYDGVQKMDLLNNDSLSYDISYDGNQALAKAYHKDFYNSDGSINKVNAYIMYNIGRSGFKNVVDVLTGKTDKVRSVARGNIKNQRKDLVIGTDMEIATNYYKFVASKMNTSQNDITNNILSKNTSGEASVPVSTSSGISVSPSSYKGVVVKIEDGDTISVKDSSGKTTNIRLYGCDAFEVEHKESSKPYDEPYGQKAKEYAKKLLKDKVVTVNYKNKDKYNRDVSQVITADGKDFSLAMLHAGYAVVPSGFVKEGEYYKAQEKAKASGVGVWSLPAEAIVKPRTGLKDPENGANPTMALTEEEARALTEVVKQKSINESSIKLAKNPNAATQNKFLPIKDNVSYKLGSKFGVKEPIRGGRPHAGQDISVPVGTDVIAAADGVVTNKVDQSKGGGYGNYVEIDHKNGFVTRYGHLSAFSLKSGTVVKYKDVIGKSGNSGHSSGPHIHYEVRYKGTAVNPFGTQPLNQYISGQLASYTSSIKPEDNPSAVIPTDPSNPKPSKEEDIPGREHVTPENTVYNESKLAEALFSNINRYSMLGLNSALPAIKVYITVGNENDTILMSTVKTKNQYYELKGIKDFRLACSSDKNPVDTCTMYVANPSHLNTDAYSSLNRMPQTVVNQIGTDFELQYLNSRLQIKPGTKIHVRLGYGNSIDDLEVVFNGSVVEVDNSRKQVLGIVCSGFGKELINDIIYPTKPEWLNNQSTGITTSSLVGISLTNHAISHFGYTSGFIADKIKDNTDPEARKMAPRIFSLLYNWFFDFNPAQYKSRLYINTFTPCIERREREFSNYYGWLTGLWNAFDNKMGSYPFPIFRMTAWDCIKQAEYRHPNSIVKPMMFEDRMTLFHGIKEQFYFYKDISRTLQESAAEGDKGSIDTYYNKRLERCKPAVNIHVATSATNIISNGIRINSQYSTKVVVSYLNNKNKDDSIKPWEKESFSMMIDDNLSPWDIRAKELNLSGCLGKYSAFLYGTTELKKESEQMYGGNIRLIGNPSIKTGDYIFIDDSEQRLLGYVLVRECNHIFSAKDGYITDIVPGQYVESANFLHSTLWPRIALTLKAVTPKMMSTISKNYSSEELNVVAEYLKLMGKLGSSMEDIDAGKGRFHDKSEVIVSAVLPTLGYFMTRNVLRLVAIKPLTKAPIGVIKAVYTVAKFGVQGTFKGLTSSVVLDSLLKGTNAADTAKLKQEARAALTAINNVYIKAAAKARVPLDAVKASKIGTTIRAAYNAKRDASLILKSGSWIAKATYWSLNTARKAAIGASLGAMLVVGTIGLANLVMDIVLFACIKYATNKLEESALTRQPLLFYPLIKGGKPYIGGMSGVVRNSWWESVKEEAGKTLDTISRSATILSANAALSDNKKIANILSVISANGVNNTAAVSTYITDNNGNQVTGKGLMVKEQGVKDSENTGGDE